MSIEDRIEELKGEIIRCRQFEAKYVESNAIQPDLRDAEMGVTFKRRADDLQQMVEWLEELQWRRTAMRPDGYPECREVLKREVYD